MEYKELHMNMQTLNEEDIPSKLLSGKLCIEEDFQVSCHIIYKAILV